MRAAVVLLLGAVPSLAAAADGPACWLVSETSGTPPVARYEWAASRPGTADLPLATAARAAAVGEIPEIPAGVEIHPSYHHPDLADADVINLANLLGCKRAFHGEVVFQDAGLDAGIRQFIASSRIDVRLMDVAAEQDTGRIRAGLPGSGLSPEAARADAAGRLAPHVLALLDTPSGSKARPETEKRRVLVTGPAPPAAVLALLSGLRAATSPLTVALDIGPAATVIEMAYARDAAPPDMLAAAVPYLVGTCLSSVRAPAVASGPGSGPRPDLVLACPASSEPSE